MREEGNGFRIAMDTLINGRLSVAAGCLCVIEDCLQEAIQYACERQQHGKVIAKHQLEVIMPNGQSKVQEIFNDTVLGFNKFGEEVVRTTIEEPTFERPATMHVNSI